MPIETDAPLVHEELDEAICTLHSPSKVFAMAGVASKTLANSTLVNLALRNALMVITFPH